MEIDELITYIILIIVAAVLIKIFAWLLPLIVVLAIIYVIYRYLTDEK
ncbi:MAG: hypothetical protein IJP12_01805 [Methanobrevibacter sp.]|nr:hypothetical protein [Methanobrevibacter sp.]